MITQDSSEQVANFRSSPLGRVLLEEGIANDVRSVVNVLRREASLGVSDWVSLEVLCGETVAWALYWNKEDLRSQALVQSLIINDVDMTNAISTSLNESVPEPAHLDDFKIVTVGEGKFKVGLRIK